MALLSIYYQEKNKLIAAECKASTKKLEDIFTQHLKKVLNNLHRMYLSLDFH